MITKEQLKKLPYAIIGIITGIIFRRMVDSYILGLIYTTITTLLLSMIIFTISKIGKRNR